MSAIEEIINRLGYGYSENLLRLKDIASYRGLSWHYKRVVSKLAPYAVYVIDGKIITAFFDDLNMRADLAIHTKIWNAQIPIVISDEGDSIVVYDGRRLKLKASETVRLKDVIEQDMACLNESSMFSYWNVTDRLMQPSREFDVGSSSLNSVLVDNLRFITKKLRQEYNISFATRLVLRILFIRYLIDRGIDIGYMGLNGEPEKSRSRFLEIVQDKSRFLGLLDHLKSRFNGNLFELEDSVECREITKEALGVIYSFLTAKEELQSGQLLLFPYYDFNIIPIELISSIYEILLGKEKKDRLKAFYTPDFLADYIVDRTVGRRLAREGECRVLDPSCGSGIFLVKALRRILEYYAGKDGFVQDKNQINELITHNIFGVDYSEEAVDVTVFSLYITLFDYQNPKKLGDYRLPLLKDRNVFYGDFFDERRMAFLSKQSFSIIIGNPPWGSVKQDLYKRFCKKRGVIAQNGEICIAFLLKACEIGRGDTECSFIIPSKTLYKRKRPSVEFRKRLLKGAQINHVLELSSIRTCVFKGAIAPAAVVSFLCRPSTPGHKIEYISLKPNSYMEEQGAILIEPNDIKYVEQDYLLNDDDLWKILVYGGYWDYEILRGLKEQFETIKKVGIQKSLVFSKGLQDNVGDKKDASHLIGKKILNSAEAIDHFYLDENATSYFSRKEIHRPRRKEINDAPYVLFKKGLDCDDYSIRAAFSNNSFLFKETVSCIKGKKEDEFVLLNICGLLNSSLFSYLNLMIGSSVGIEREQVFLDEIKQYPYVYSDKLVALVKEAQRAKSGLIFDELRASINRHVLEMYGLQDNHFIDYALTVQIPMLCGTYQEKKCNKKELKKYASVVTNEWKRLFGDSGVYCQITVYPSIKQRFTAVQMEFSLEKNENGTVFVDSIDDDVQLLTDFMIYQLNDRFYQTKNVLGCGDNAVVIVKPIESRNWHPAAAIKDSAKVFGDILIGEISGGEGTYET